MQGIRLSDNFLFTCAAFLLLIGYLLNLGVQPFYLEEPRRTIIAMELLERKNLWVPTLIGEFYYNKPPLYNWILIGFASLWGGFDEFALRLPTVLSTFGIAALAFFTTKRYTRDVVTAILSAWLFLSAAGVLLYFSMIAEIDLFYSLIVFASILAIYHFGEKERYWTLFLLVYCGCAMGVLTKGLPSFVFTAVSLLVYFVDKKRFKILLGPAHFAGIGLLVMILYAYYGQYAKYHDLSLVWMRMLTESGDRTAVSNSLGDFISHLFWFPINWIGDMAPASFLLLFLWRKDWKKVLLQQNSLLRFCTLQLIFNALPYWISPGTRMRYVYMLYPLACMVLAWAYQQRIQDIRWPAQVFKVLSLGILLVFALGSWVLPFLPELQFMQKPALVCALLAFLLLLLCFGLAWKSPNQVLLYLLIGFAVVRIVFDLTVLPQRKQESGAQRDRALAAKIDRIVGDAPLYTAFQEKVVAYTTIVYLNRLRKKTVQRKDHLQKSAYYLVPLRRAPKQVEILMTTEYGGQIKALVKIDAQLPALRPIQ